MASAIDIQRLSEAARTTGSKGLPPVHLWHPPFCGAIDMRIAPDGTWYYQGTPIGRPALVRLFSTILRKDPSRYVLVTPVEMVEITVEDSPFIAIDMDCIETELGSALSFLTNVEDRVTANGAHPIRFTREASGGYRPYVTVRDGLEARLTRQVYQELVALGETRMVDGAEMFGIASAGAFFPMAPASEIASA
jgi:uncharacterized protein